MLLPRPKDRGFTLLEMAIVIVVVGIVLSALSTVLPALIISAKAKKTDAILERFELTLKGYAISNGRLPCPDTDGDGREDRDDKNTSDPSDDICDDYTNAIPFRTLGLSSGNDAWNKPIKYGVYEDLIKTTAGSGSRPACTELRTIITRYDPLGGNVAPESGKANTADPGGTNRANKAYVIASGGPKNLDGDGDNFFDGQNEGPDLTFDNPERVESHAPSGSTTDNDYDDQVRAVSFAHLSGQICSGDSAGNNPLAFAENMFNNGCSNAPVDDDADGLVDCYDPDCTNDPACEDSGIFKITTESLPNANMNSSYFAILEASGGKTPYEWTLTDNGGITGLSIPNPYNAKLFGTINACNNAYRITVQAKDSSSTPSVKKTFTLTVVAEPTLLIARTSGDKSESITWSLASQRENFKTSGARLGKINWTLTSGGATGFTVLSTGDETCVIKKTGSTAAPGLYTFTLTATDDKCENNKASKTLYVNVQESGAGSPGEATGITAFKFSSSAYYPKIIPAANDLYFLTYETSDLLKTTMSTIKIGNDGNNIAAKNSLTYSRLYFPRPFKVKDGLFAINYSNDNFSASVLSLTIDSGGALTYMNWTFLARGRYPNVVMAGPNVFASFFNWGSGCEDNWSCTSTTGRVYTGRVLDTGVITGTITGFNGKAFPKDLVSPNNPTPTDISPVRYETEIVKVSEAENIYAVLYTDSINWNGHLTTMKIMSDGTYPAVTSDFPHAPFIDSTTFSSYAYLPKIIHATGNIYAMVYRSAATTCTLTTMEIDSNGVISRPALNYNYSFDSSCNEPAIIHVANQIFAIAYRSGSAGKLAMLEIGDDGAITKQIISSSNFAAFPIKLPDIIHIEDNVFAIVYTNYNDSSGWVSTVKINQ